MIKIFNLQFENNNMELRELLEIFGKGNVIDASLEDETPLNLLFSKLRGGGERFDPGRRQLMKSSENFIL